MVNSGKYSAGKMCKVLNVSRNSYYTWLKSKDQCSGVNHPALIQQSQEIFEWSRGSYGSHRITEELKRRGYHYSRSWIARLMNRIDLKSKCTGKYKATTDSKHKYPVSPNLVERDFRAGEIGKVWVSDITCILVGVRFYYTN